MSSTNKTTNYGLPQFIGSDIPTWLGDVNGSMAAIDAQMKRNEDAGTKANADVVLVQQGLSQLQAVVDGLVSGKTITDDDIQTLKGQMTGVQEQVAQVIVDVNELEQIQGKVYKGTLSIGETTLTLSVDEVTSTSLVDVYTSEFGTAPTNVQVNETQKTVVLTFEERSSLLQVAVKVA